MSDRPTLTASPAAAAAAAARPARLTVTTATIPQPTAGRPQMRSVGIHGGPHRPGRTQRRRQYHPQRAADAGAPLILTARSLKVTIVLDAKQIAQAAPPTGPHPQPFEVQIEDGQVVGGQLNPKSVRKAIAAIKEHGTDKVAVVIQGRLTEAGEIAEAGISAQIKGPKPVPAA